MIGVWMLLIIYPTLLHVSFDASPDNELLVVTIESDTTPAQPYFEYQEYPILEDDQDSIDIPRHKLPRGAYHVTSQLIRWVDGHEQTADSTDTIIKVN